MQPWARVGSCCALALLLACPKPSQKSDAGGPVGSQVAAGATPIDAAQVSAWVRYAGFLASQGPAQQADGGPLPNAQLLARATADAEMRADAGLSEAQIDAIEELVADFVAIRGTVKLTGADALAEFEKVAAKMPFEQRKKAEAALAELRTQTNVPVSLGPLEARYGKSAVEAVVAAEAQVTQSWEALMNAQGGAK